MKRSKQIKIMNGLFFLLAVITFYFFYHWKIMTSLLVASILTVVYLMIKRVEFSRLVFISASLIAFYWSFSTKIQSFTLTTEFIIGFILAILMYTLLFNRLILFCLSVEVKNYSEKIIVLFRIYIACIFLAG